MNVLVTGGNGTVGSRLVQLLQKKGCIVTLWNRKRVPIDNYHAMEAFVSALKPDIVFHLAVASTPTGKMNESWLVNYEWASELAWITKILDIQFVFTSTVMVFSDNAVGPFDRFSKPDASEGYGNEKRMAEERVFHQNPRAIIARLGWQIGDAPGSNNMIDFFDKQMREHGQVDASSNWLPSCSFLDDTVDALYRIAQLSPGLYMLNSNTRWSFYTIAAALNKHYGDPWVIRETEDFVYDQRMQEDRISMPLLSVRLKDLS
ncbi:MAG: sugar nucleotide-binding protein [Calditrichia bacterium]